MAGNQAYRKETPVKKYCLEHSSKLHPVQEQLIEETLEHEWGKMLGSSEVLNMNSLLVKITNAKKVLDVGVFTGASSLAAALHLPEGGIVVACDMNEEFTNIAKKWWKKAGVEDKVENIIIIIIKIIININLLVITLIILIIIRMALSVQVKLHLAPAAETLTMLLEKGEEGTFDFAFIDANKEDYYKYFELCLQLIRKGGVIAFDNTLWQHKVLEENVDSTTEEIKTLNDKLALDNRVMVVQLNIGDGYTLATKL